MYYSWTGKICIFITVINFPDNKMTNKKRIIYSFVQKTERMISTCQHLHLHLHCRTQIQYHHDCSMRTRSVLYARILISFVTMISARFLVMMFYHKTKYISIFIYNSQFFNLRFSLFYGMLMHDVPYPA